MMIDLQDVIFAFRNAIDTNSSDTASVRNAILAKGIETLLTIRDERERENLYSRQRFRRLHILESNRLVTSVEFPTVPIEDIKLDPASLANLMIDHGKHASDSGCSKEEVAFYASQADSRSVKRYRDRVKPPIPTDD